jgi:thiosulfate dehydrogenase (quinone) large subunit
VPSRPPNDPRKWPAWARSFPGGHLLVLRAFLGVTFCFAGLQKLANGSFFDAKSPGGIAAQLRASALTTPVGHLLHPLIGAAPLIGVIIAFGELGVGVGTLLGLYSRVAAAGGMLLALTFFLTVSYNTSPYYYGPDIVFLFAWTPIVLNGAGALSLDAYFADRRERMKAGLVSGFVGDDVAEAGKTTEVDDALLTRRTALTKLAAASVIGAVVLFLGGLVATASRAFGRANHSDAESFPDLPSSTSGTVDRRGTSTSTTFGSSGAPGSQTKLIVDADKVAVGAAHGFTDPFQQIPAYLVHPAKGEFRCFSAVCTHAGCTVGFVKSVEQFQCPCHGSIFSAATGDVIQGPAPLPLPEIAIELSGGNVYLTDRFVTD